MPESGPLRNKVQFQADQEAAEVISKLNSLNHIKKGVFKEITAAVKNTLNRGIS